MSDVCSLISSNHFPGQISHLENPHGLALALLAHILQKPKTWVLAHSDICLSPTQQEQLNDLASRLENGEPLAYLTGEQEFFGLSFLVNSSVLIPRPETELLVEQALLWLAEHPNASQAADVGTGSGCIAISLAFHRPELYVLASDISYATLDVATRNSQKHDMSDRINLVHADLLSDISSSFDLICANLPYIPTAKVKGVNSLPYEPTLALDGGSDGLTLIRRLLSQCSARINHPGLILLETESSLGSVTRDIAQSCFPVAKVELLQDLAGLDRLVSIEVL